MNNNENVINIFLQMNKTVFNKPIANKSFYHRD